MSLPPDCEEYQFRRYIQQTLNEIVRVQCCYSKCLQSRRWKVAKVKGHDNVGPCNDCGSENMPVVWARQRECWHKILVASDKAISHIKVHQVPRLFQLLPLQVRTIFEKVS